MDDQPQKKLFEAVRGLHNCRNALAAAKMKEAERLAELEKLYPYMQYNEAVNARKEIAATETEVKAVVSTQAIKLAESTGEKKFPGVVVTLSNVVKYEDAKGKEYCLKHGLANFLKLDADAFGKWLLSNMQQGESVTAAMGLDEIGATLGQHMGTRIDFDLSKAITEELLKNRAAMQEEPDDE